MKTFRQVSFLRIQWPHIGHFFFQLFCFAYLCRGFIGVVCQPSTFSSLELGYVCTPEGQCFPVQEVDLPLWQHGEDGQDPKDFAFRFKADDQWHHIQV